MSVSTIEAGVIRIGDGVTVEFSFSFEAISAATIKVSSIVGNSLIPVTSGITTFLNLDGIGGTVTFDVAPAASTSYYIYRDTESTQLISVSKQTRYDPEVVENVWDKLTYLVQELEADIDRSVKTVPGADPAELLTSIDEAVARSEAAAADAEAAAAQVWVAALYGVLPTGLDISTALQTLINTVGADGGGDVIMDFGTYGFANKVSLKENVRLIGKGCGQYPPASAILDADFLALNRTRFVALAGFPATTPIVEIATVALAKYCIDDAALLNIAIDCNLVADYGVNVISAKHCQVDGVIIFRPVVRGFYIGCFGVGSEPTETNADTQFNQFGMDRGVFVWCGNSGTAAGFISDGSTIANVNQNLWGLVKAVVNTGEGFEFKNADNEVVQHLNIYSFGGTGVKFNGDADPALTARNNTIVRCEAGGVSGRVLAETGSEANRILALSTTNGSILPVIETGATLNYALDTGAMEQWSSATARIAMGTSAAWVNGALPASLDFHARVIGQTTGRTVMASVQAYTRGTVSGQEDGEFRFITKDAGADVVPLILSGGNITVGVGGTQFKSLNTFAQAVDLPSIAAGATHSFTITATGASPGDSVHLGIPTGFLGSGLSLDKFGVTGAGVVTVYVRNPTGAAIDIGNEFWRATIFDAA